MPPKALKQILFTLESTAEFLAKIDPENKRLSGKRTFPSPKVFFPF